MASKLEIVEYISDQIAHCGEVRHKKMFGEYMVYLNNRPIFMICDNILYVKINMTTTKLLGQDNIQGYPYDGAKPHYVIEDIDNREFMEALAIELEKITPLPKPKRKR